jgi:hypothetical protein
VTRNRTALVLAAVACAALVVVLVVLLTRSGGSTPSRTAATTPHVAASSASGSVFPAIPSPPTDTTTSGAAGSGSATATATSTAPPVTEDQARTTVVAYIDDVNEQDRVSAGKLICTELYDAWLQNIDASNSDFNFVITNARFTGSDPIANGGRVAHYVLTFNDNSTNAVNFTLVDEGGPKICGEAHA